jgi:large subunit ribosomal protein L19
MLDLIRRVTLKGARTEENFKTGDTVEVSVKVREGEKERVQLYKGVVMKIAGAGASRSFTVRKISDGVGVERTFPFGSPSIDKVRIVSHGTVRRARLFYLRNLEGRSARIDSELVTTAKEPKTEAPKAQN